MAKDRIHYLDNLRILLTVFVIFVHIAMMYGAMSSWYYNEVRRPDPVTEGTLTILLLLGRSCGLGIFFALTGYFTAIKISEAKASGSSYLRSRLLRLGIPLLFFCPLVSLKIIRHCPGSARPLTSLISHRRKVSQIHH